MRPQAAVSTKVTANATLITYPPAKVTAMTDNPFQPPDAFHPQFLNPQMNPALNPRMNPMLNPQANPILNPKANPMLNPLANPALNPFGKPEDLGITPQ